MSAWCPIHVGGFDISFTNSALWACIAVICASLLFILAPRNLVPTRLQSVAESIYELVYDITHEVLHENARRYFPFVLTLFLFILFANVLGLIPYSFTVTSHNAITLVLALACSSGSQSSASSATALAISSSSCRQAFRCFCCRWWFVIEIVSYFIRPMSLSIRLFANMMAGHMMLKVMAGFVVMLGVTAGWLPLAAMVGLMGLELVRGRPSGLCLRTFDLHVSQRCHAC